jgi:hypothetical protein
MYASRVPLHPAEQRKEPLEPFDGIGAAQFAGVDQTHKHPVGAGLYARVLNSSWRSRLSAGHGTFMVVFACSSILFSATNTSRETVTV